MMRNFFFTALLIAVATSCTEAPVDYKIEKTAYGERGMVVSAHPLATQAGVEILEKGGNAVDASIAVQLALAVVYPRAGNLGGGGFMVYRDQKGEVITLDYREKAPSASDKDMYLDAEGNVIEGLSTAGHMASGIPGTVAGLVESHARFGSLEFKQLFEPAIRFASDGFALTDTEANRLNEYAPRIKQFNDASCPFVKDQGTWATGEMVKQPDLAKTLRAIASQGFTGFYSGDVADAIVAEIQSGGGIITHADLLNYRPIWRDPITTRYRGFDIYSMPPSSSGGVALAQLLELVEPYPIGSWGPDDVRTKHLMVEAERRVYADRAEYLGDMDHWNVPLDTLLDPEYLLYRMSDFSPDSATQSVSIQAGNFAIALESFETTHLTVVDADGNAVSVTTTLNSNYGSKVMVDGAGFFMNNEMDDFSIKPGVPNQFGLIGADANAIAPGKRMLSSMTPTIVSKDDELFITVGTPGGSTIITSVFQVILNMVDFDMTASEAVQRKRFHHQWLPDRIMYEQGALTTSDTTQLSQKGHDFRQVNYIGMVEVIHQLEDGRLEGAADNRGDDHAQGPSK